jgi:hypothetical protein
MGTNKGFAKEGASIREKMLPENPEISWTEKISNEEVYERVGLTENLMQKVIQRKLGLFGHNLSAG